MIETALLIGGLIIFNATPFTLPEPYLAPVVVETVAEDTFINKEETHITTVVEQSTEETTEHICGVYEEVYWDDEYDCWVGICECGEEIHWVEYEDDAEDVEEETEVCEDDEEECLWSWHEGGYYICDVCGMKAYVEDVGEP